MVALLRSFIRVDQEGKLLIPPNIQRAASLTPGQMVEVKLLGKNSIMISPRRFAR